MLAPHEHTIPNLQVMFFERGGVFQVLLSRGHTQDSHRVLENDLHFLPGVGNKAETAVCDRPDRPDRLLEGRPAGRLWGLAGGWGDACRSPNQES
jgi:hypothetical protein